MATKKTTSAKTGPSKAEKIDTDVKAKTKATAKVTKPVTAKEAPKKELATKKPATKTTPVKKPVQAKGKATKAEPKKPATKPTKPKNKTQPKEELLDAPTISTFPSLKRDSKDTGPITFLQANLKQRGYYSGPVDGNFGPNTEKAVIEFQKDLGKPVSGTVGPKTWEALQSSKLMKAKPVQQVQPQQQTGSTAGTRVLIEGLSKFQAELLVKLLSGHTECRIL